MHRFAIPEQRLPRCSHAPIRPSIVTAVPSPLFYEQLTPEHARLKPAQTAAHPNCQRPLHCTTPSPQWSIGDTSSLQVLQSIAGRPQNLRDAAHRPAHSLSIVKGSLYSVQRASKLPFPSAQVGPDHAARACDWTMAISAKACVVLPRWIVPPSVTFCAFFCLIPQDLGFAFTTRWAALTDARWVN